MYLLPTARRTNIKFLEVVFTLNVNWLYNFEIRSFCDVCIE